MPYKKDLILVLCLVSMYSQVALSQATKRHKFGTVSEEYVKMDSYAKDTNASVVYLYDYGEVEIQGDSKGFKKIYQFHQCIKILSESEVDRGDFSLTYNKKSENISRLEGMTYNVLADGTIEKVKLEKKDIYKENVDGEYQRLRFSLPKVKKGSVIELFYRRTEEGFRSLDTWYFQQPNVPVVYSEYKTVIPEWFSFTPLLNGSLKLASKNSVAVAKNISVGIDQGAGPTQYASLKPNFITTSYVMKDVPAFISEPYLTTTMDHLSWLKFQLTTITWPQSAPENYLGTWGKLEERLLEDDYFGGRLSKTGKLKKWVGPTALQSLSTEEKAQKIVEYVASTMDWDGYYSFVAGEQLDEVLENGKGSSGDINLLLIALLRKEGIDAHPMLISTRSHGRVQEAYPLVSQFNHVIALAHIDSLWIPLDAISDNLAFGMITRDDLNHRGWLIIEGNSQWIDIHPMYTDKRITRAMVSINEENLLDVKLFVDCMEYDSFDANNQFSGSESEEEFMDEFFVEEYSDLEMESFEITSKSKEQFSFNSKFQTTDYLNEVGDMFYLQPLLHVGLEENFFKLEERKYPVDFGAPVDWQFNLSMILPEDIEFEALPKPSKVVLPNGDGEFIYNFQRTGNMVNLVSRIKVNKTLFEPEEYEALKNFFDYVVEKQAEQLVFRRKS